MEDDAERIIFSMRIPEYMIRFSMQQASDGSAATMLVDRRKSPPKSPTLVLVDKESGDEDGRRFLSSCRVLLTPSQITSGASKIRVKLFIQDGLLEDCVSWVIDLKEIQPENLLKRVLGGLEILSTDGDHSAAAVKENLRIMVVGGDKFVGQVLGIIAKMNVSHPLPIAPVPLGTSNNLHNFFGWGRKNVKTDLNSVKSLLIEVANSRVITIDSWLAIMTVHVSNTDSLDCSTIPQSLRALYLPRSTIEGSVQNLSGRFWNHFSFGMDAQLASYYHQKTHIHPKSFKNESKNQSFYEMVRLTKEWSSVSCFRPASSRGINHLLKIKFAKHDEDWQELVLRRRPTESGWKSVL